MWETVLSSLRLSSLLFLSLCLISLLISLTILFLSIFSSLFHLYLHLLFFLLFHCIHISCHFHSFHSHICFVFFYSLLLFSFFYSYLYLSFSHLFIFTFPFLLLHFYLHVYLLHSFLSLIFSLSLAPVFTSIHISVLLLYLYLLISSLSRTSLIRTYRSPLTPPERHCSRLRFISANERFRDELVLEWEQFRRIRTHQRGRGRRIVKSSAKIAPRDCARHSESPERSQRAEFMRFVSIEGYDSFVMTRIHPPLRLSLSLLFRPISVFSISPRFTTIT